MERNRHQSDRPRRRHPAARSRITVGAASLGAFGLLLTSMLNHETAVAASPPPTTTTTATTPPPITRRARQVVYLLLPDGRIVAVDPAAVPSLRPRHQVRTLQRVPITRSHGSR